MKKKNMNRRKFVQAAATSVAGAAALSGCSSLTKLAGARDPSGQADGWAVNESDKFDFIIVGSGAGGGPLAAGLAKAGYRVLLLEAGNTKENTVTKTPVMHARASEDELLNWSYFVDRYAQESADKQFEKLNSKYDEKNQGVFYPRAAGLGGSTRVNALISLYPDHQDWNHLSETVNDLSYAPREMAQLFKKMQKSNGGWLNLSQASPVTLLKDQFLTKMAIAALEVDGKGFGTGVGLEVLKKTIVEQQNLALNPNYPGYTSLEGGKVNGVFNIPFNATDGVRKGVREYILATDSQFQNKLFIKPESLCTKVIFDQNNKTKAIGIEFIEGAHAYKADVMNQAKASQSYVKKVAYAAKEVILAGGVFSTPQLMMLSGIGPAAELDKLNINVIKNLPGVGRNLQDRYEVSVVSELNNPISILKDCTFARNNDFAADPCFADYLKDPKHHLYGTNGVALSLIRKSSSQQPTPDLCIFGLPGYFKGYYPGYSKDTVPKNSHEPNYFTWAILKGHTRNHAGTVQLKSNDPRDTPLINFKYFHDENNGAIADLNAVMSGIKIARKINDKIGSKYFKSEVYPGNYVDNDADLKSWIKKESWGHHASCTNKMGLASDPMAVVDSQFKVHGIQNLRIVDASVFPDIPGLFIMVPTLIMSEKAKEMILEEYQKS